MKTIIMPTDFSAASLNAVNYALGLARQVKASITLVHVCQYPVSMNEVPVSAQVFKEILDDATDRIAKLKQELEHKTSGAVHIYTEIKEGNVVVQLQELCDMVKPFAVVIGSHGTGPVERMLFGSNTLSAIRHLAWPLFVVPQGGRFTSISRMGLACDLHKVISSVHADVIKKMVREFQANLHILNVNTAVNKPITDDAIEGSEWLLEMFGELKPEFHFVNRPNVDEAVNEFAEKYQLDLLILIPKNHNLVDRIIHKSHTKELVLNTHVTVLAIHE